MGFWTEATSVGQGSNFRGLRKLLPSGTEASGLKNGCFTVCSGGRRKGYFLVPDDEPAARDGADAYFAAVYEGLDESTDFGGGAEVEGLAQFDGRNEGMALQ